MYNPLLFIDGLYFVGIISNNNTGLPATNDSDFDSRSKITLWWSLW